MPKFATVLKRLAARTGVARTAADQIYLGVNKVDVTYYPTGQLDPARIASGIFSSGLIPGLDAAKISVYTPDPDASKRSDS